MTINLKNFLKDNTKLSRMGDFQELKPVDGLEVSSISADLYDNGRDDLTLFYFKEGANYAAVTTTNSIKSESIVWNEKSNKKTIKAILVNTKNANTFTGQQGIESLDSISKNLSRILTIRESKSKEGVSETVKIKDIMFASTGVIGEKFPVEKINKLLNELGDTPYRSARLISCMVLCDPNGELVKDTTGICWGEILKKPKYPNGEFESIFWVKEANRVYGELNHSQLSKLGSRGKAARELAPFLKKEMGLI